MTDDEFIAGLENCTLAEEQFHHPEHVKMAFIYLHRYPALEALQHFSNSLAKFAASMGKAERYHETITWAFFFLIRERVARAPTVLAWNDFAGANPDLLDWGNNILKRYYRDEILSSDFARRTFVFPDKCALIV
jgi:hypothetical protein